VIFSYHSTSPFRGLPLEYCNPVWYGKKLEWWRMQWGSSVFQWGSNPHNPPPIFTLGGANRQWKHFKDMYNRLYSIPACDGQTDGQTDILPRHCPRYAYAWRGENYLLIVNLWTTAYSYHETCTHFVAFSFTKYYKVILDRWEQEQEIVGGTCWARRNSVFTDKAERAWLYRSSDDWSAGWRRVQRITGTWWS